ncbi:NAD(P)H-binding protein [Kribbella sp. NPDC003505]|uniref:NAD(P)H-binding protein n=1 Tax=Kribbella sp. NPDC003505 TaxID=3154448 RepID=UPI0033B46F84
MTHLILGGSGKVGRRLTRLLDLADRPARPASRAAATVFDWHDESTWTPALDGVTSMFVVGPGSATDWSPQLTRLLDLAHDLGTEHAVLLSARAVEFLPDGAVGRAEQALRRGPIPWTILRPSHFAQNFTEAMFAPVDGRIIAPAGTGAEPFIDVADVAAVAAAVMTKREYDGRVLALSGPEAVTFEEAADQLAQTTGVSVRFEDESDGDHVDRLRAAGTPEMYIRWRMAMLNAIRSGADSYVSTGVTDVLHRPATTFATWAQREAAPAASH